MVLSRKQINAIRAILATKKGRLSKSKDYTIGALHDLFNGRKVRDRGALIGYAIDILNILSIKVVTSSDDSGSVYYCLPAPTDVNTLGILKACEIEYCADELEKYNRTLSGVRD